MIERSEANEMHQVVDTGRLETLIKGRSKDTQLQQTIYIMAKIVYKEFFMRMVTMATAKRSFTGCSEVSWCCGLT